MSQRRSLLASHPLPRAARRALLIAALAAGPAAAESVAKPAGEAAHLGPPATQVLFFTGLSELGAARFDLVIANPGEAKDAQPALTGFDRRGVALAGLPPLAALRPGEVRVVASERLPPGLAALRVESARDVAAWLRLEEAGGAPGETVPALSWNASQVRNRLDFPLVAEAATGAVTLLNPNPAPARLRVLGLSEGGEALTLASLAPLAPMESRTYALADLTEGKAFALLRVVASLDLVGIAQVRSGTGDLALFPALATIGETWRLPLPAEAGGIETRVRVVNPGDRAAAARLEVLAADGSPLGRAQAFGIAAGASVTLPNLDAAALPPGAASLRLAADAPLAAHLLFVERGGIALTGAPAVLEGTGDARGVRVLRNGDGSLAASPLLRRAGRAWDPLAETPLHRDGGSETVAQWAPAPGEAYGAPAEPPAPQDDSLATRSSIWFRTVSPRFPVGALTDGWLHAGGSNFHHPWKGYSKADDSYALDLNLAGNADSGRDVVAVEAGTVRQVDNCYGWVLVEHPNRGTVAWQGWSYGSYFSGYLHMRNVQVAVGNAVARGQKLGEISGRGSNCNDADFSHHLHFALYVGRTMSSAPINAHLESVDPGRIGGYGGLSYGGNLFNENVDDWVIYTNHIFSKTGTPTDWTESTAAGFYTHLWYTTSNTAADNSATWSMDVGVAAGTYQVYVFVPRSFATTTNARYKVYQNSTLHSTVAVNQSTRSDEWVDLGVNLALNAGDRVKVLLDDDTDDANRQVGFDVIKVYRKSDPGMTHAPNCNPAVAADRWKGEYFENMALTGTPSLVRDDGVGNLNFNWDSGGPGGGCGVGTDQFSARWTRSVPFSTAGTYRFTVRSDDGFRLLVDGIERRREWRDQGPTTYTVDVQLTAGNHPVVLEYYENGGGATIQLSWALVATSQTCGQYTTDTVCDQHFDRCAWYSCAGLCLPRGTDVNDTCFCAGFPDATTCNQNSSICAFYNCKNKCLKRGTSVPEVCGW